MYPKRNNELEIISLYRVNYKKQFYLREISKLSNLPLKTAQNTLSILEKNKILKSKTEGKNKYFSLNLDNTKTKFFLLHAEIYQTEAFLEKYPVFKTFLKSLQTNALLIIFGSFAKLSADKNSDVDLMIVANEKEKFPFHLLPYEIHQLNLTESLFAKSLKEQETIIKEIEESHIILNNHSAYINMLWDYYGR